ncbi:YtpI family protein [Fictibacillus iocasae]|uniref:YtpI family protein n=1 Tax=Fictibacillus iocasae TaxID=2715437 RepID=A0ABW2NVI2_9BACL
MPLFVILIILSFSLYAFFKVREVRAKNLYIKGWNAAKSRLALGLFLLSFGMNELSSIETKLQLWVAIIFVIYGAALLYTGFKRYKHFTPLAQKEME